MKKLLCTGIVFITLVIHGQPLETNCIAPANSNLLGYQEVVKFVNNYHENHDRSLENHTKAVYINDTAVLFLEQFFNDSDNDKYFGFCIYLINYNYSVNGRHQLKTNQTFLYLVPVYGDRENPTSDFRALNEYYQKVKTDPMFRKRSKLDNSIPCYGTCDSSVNKWAWGSYAPQINFTRLDQKFINDPTNNEVFLLSANRAKHLDSRENYENGQGSELNKFQTKRIYFNELTIQKLGRFIREGNNRILFPMMGIYFGSYNMIKERTMQKDPYQTTVSLVPMRRMDDGSLEPDICSYIEYYRKLVDLKDKLFMLAENHGELCPKICPPGGD